MRYKKILWVTLALIIIIAGVIFITTNNHPAFGEIAEREAKEPSNQYLTTPTQSGGNQPIATQTQSTSSQPLATTAQTPTASSPLTKLKSGIGTAVAASGSSGNIKTVFVIVLENQNWSGILNSPSSSYINQTLLPQASYAQQYYNPQDMHPSEPNYLWLEAGTNLGITNDSLPDKNHQSTDNHLVTYLNKAGISWKSYQEDISGKDCPLVDSGKYTPRHNPMVYFDDVTNKNDPQSKYCIEHVRPYDELRVDLQNNTVASYNFITPNLCHGMHDSSGCDSNDTIKNGDTWLSKQIPMIMDSQAYKEGGVIFITWDESEGGDYPIGMIVLSPFAKGGGYSNNIHYTHSSTLRTIEEIFNLKKFLGDAANSNDLSDLFRAFP